jgi:hypothetical protein
VRPDEEVYVPENLLQVVPPRYRGAWKVGNSEAEIERWRAERKRHFPTAARASSREQPPATPAGAAPAPLHPAVDTADGASVRGDVPDGGVGGGGEDAGDDSDGSVDEEALFRAAAATAANSAQADLVGLLSASDVAAATSEDADGDALDEAPEEAGVGLLDGGAATAMEIVIPAGAGLLVKPPTKPAAAAAAAAAADERLGVDAAASDVAAEGDGDGAGAGGAPLCRNFVLGRCKHGVRCRFSHDRSRLANRGGRAGAGGDGGTSSAGMPKSTTACRMFLLGMCRRGAACGFSHGAVEGDAIGSRSHLLRKLLSKDVAAETAATLQCIRYVVRAGFEPTPPPAAEVGSSAAAPAEEGQP